LIPRPAISPVRPPRPGRTATPISPACVTRARSRKVEPTLRKKLSENKEIDHDGDSMKRHHDLSELQVVGKPMRPLGDTLIHGPGAKIVFGGDPSDDCPAPAAAFLGNLVEQGVRSA